MTHLKCLTSPPLSQTTSRRLTALVYIITDPRLAPVGATSVDPDCESELCNNSIDFLSSPLRWSGVCGDHAGATSLL